MNFTTASANSARHIRTTGIRLRRTRESRLAAGRLTHPITNVPSGPETSPTSESREWLVFQEMFIVFRPKFIKIAYSILRNREDAEDAVQDALLSAYIHFRSFEGRSALKTWFTRIVVNASLMMRRKRKPFTAGSDDISQLVKAIPDAQPEPEKQYAQAESQKRIHGLIKKLSPAFQEALAITYFDEMTARQAGALVGVTTGAFKSRLFRAQKQLADRAGRSFSVSSRRVLPAMKVAAV